MSETPMTCVACGQVMMRESLTTCPKCGRDLHPAAEEASHSRRPSRFDKPEQGGFLASISAGLRRIFRG